MVRTIEQLLGPPPLNQKLAAATPMYDAFTSTPATAPFTAVANQTPLTQGVDPKPSCGPDAMGKTGAAAAAQAAKDTSATAVRTDRQAVAAQWQAWAVNQHFTGANAVPDYANPEQMNRWMWYPTIGWTKPCPGDSTICALADVRGGYLPSTENDG